MLYSAQRSRKASCAELSEGVSGMRIISRQGHYEVYGADGSFLLSADTKTEAMEELSAWEEEHTA